MMAPSLGICSVTKFQSGNRDVAREGQKSGLGEIKGGPTNGRIQTNMLRLIIMIM